MAELNRSPRVRWVNQICQSYATLMSDVFFVGTYIASRPCFLSTDTKNVSTEAAKDVYWPTSLPTPGRVCSVVTAIMSYNGIW